jgi:SAM-dependent methyltransferase
VINRTQLLADMQAVLRTLEADLLERSEAIPAVQVVLRSEYQRARTAERTAQSYEDWRSDYITQIAAAWVLSGVFVRFLEDNRLIDPPRIAGPDERLVRARDEHELYFRAHPTETDREYLHHVFDELAQLPGAKEIFGAHNPIHELPNWLSGDAAGELLRFFQKIDANTGALIHDFADPDWHTRFLGDLYQDLSEAARKKYALLQTPEFVEEFMLDRTLDPALDEFGLAGFRLLDPTCGSGHFLLGAFQRLLDRWLRTEPGTGKRQLVQRSLDAVYGVDVNPYAVAIARFRLLVAALQSSGITRLREAPGFRINVTAGDSLLHGQRFGELNLKGESVDLRRVGGSEHVYRAEDLAELHRILGQQYHVVVGNPPYITVKDAALNQAYRNRYSTCHRQYSLAVPFTERFFELAVYGHNGGSAGYVGMITANSFMKREFGKRLIEEFFPHLELTHVIDTSGAYIPGHGTPTVILFGRHRKPVSHEVRAVLGIRGEPSTPDDPAQGKVWRSIVEHLDHAGSQNEFVSVADMARQTFASHPWSIGGGGVIELKEQVEGVSEHRLESHITEIGRTTHTGEDDVFYLPISAAKTLGLSKYAVPLIIGEGVRDWQLDYELAALFPYDQRTGEPIEIEAEKWEHHFWLFKTKLKNRMDFGNYIEDRGLRWFDHSMFFPARFRTPLSIAFAFVATHNHFVLDRGGKVFKQSAPIIKLLSNATEEDHLALLGLLNSSTACFWMQQVCHNKGGARRGFIER